MAGKHPKPLNAAQKKLIEHYGLEREDADEDARRIARWIRKHPKQATISLKYREEKAGKLEDAKHDLETRRRAYVLGWLSQEQKLN